METANRLPDPSMIDSFLRDRASVQKLKKAIRKSIANLDTTAADKVRADYNRIAKGKQLEEFLTKLDKSTPGPDEAEKTLLAGLIASIRDNGKAGLSVHPGFASVRSLDKAEARKFEAARGRIEKTINEIVKQKKYDTYIANVFGKSKVGDARDRFDAGFLALERLSRNNAIVIDSMKKDKVWGCGGLTSEEQMALPDGALDKVDYLLTTIVHEMTHAMRADLKTGDTYYRHSPDFPLAQEERKVVTADYYAEVFDRILKKDPGDVYVPRDASEKAVTVDKVLDRYKNEADVLVKRAWVTAINIHGTLQMWGDAAEKGQSFSVTPAWLKTEVLTDAKLRFARNASRVLGMTIHKRAALSGKQNEITRLDLSIIDNKLNILGKLLGCIGKVLTLPVDVKAFDQVRIDHVLKHALMILNGDKDTPGLFSKNIDKDIVVIRSLSELNDAPNWQNLVPSLANGLPDAMRQYST